MSWNYAQPVTIRFGNGRVKELEDAITQLNGKRGILITSDAFAKNGLAQQITNDSHGLICAVYSHVQPNPDVTECEACIALIKEHQCDFVVALGGGSVLDCAKAAALMATADTPVTAYMAGEMPLPPQSLPLIAIPTTAGTGSEISSVSVLSDHALKIKKPLASPAFFPKIALIDPELTLTMPRHLTACTGMDVLCHAMEAFWSRQHQPVCDSLAINALRLVFENLKTACDAPSNLAAREKMAEASLLAGLSFTVPRTNSSHACSYPLTNDLGIPHGEACALTIDYFLRINAHEDDGRIAMLSRMLGFASPLALADAICRLKRDIGIMPNLKAFNLTDEQIESLVQNSQNPILKLNPVDITPEMLREMYNQLR
jgi:alcohol dehydrogenase